MGSEKFNNNFPRENWETPMQGWGREVAFTPDSPFYDNTGGGGPCEPNTNYGSTIKKGEEFFVFNEYIEAINNNTKVPIHISKHSANETQTRVWDAEYINGYNECYYRSQLVSGREMALLQTVENMNGKINELVRVIEYMKNKKEIEN